ncbi:MAG: Fic family protein [Thaumarchaeota archaeon]|nr:Fic family protein [Nitrososphaerota archaeon]
MTKTIGGKDYFYYQDSLPGGKTVTTFVGGKDLTPEEFALRRDKTLPLHVFKLYEKRPRQPESEYHFENQPTKGLISGEELELLKLSYHQIESSLTEGEVAELHSARFVKYVHGTTAIEGNTLSESETRSLLLSDLTPNAKSVSETLEVANYKSERKFIDSYSGVTTERMILQIHRLLMAGVRKPNGQAVHAGEYRQTKVFLRDADYTPPPPELVETQMRYTIDEYQQWIDHGVHPIERASVFHARFEAVHPFEDGNGRVGREILNFMLNRSGYPEITVGVRERGRYLAALRDADKGNLVPVIDFVIDRTNASVAYMLAKTGFLKRLRETKIQRSMIKRADKEEYERYATMLESLYARGQRQVETESSLD